ncbi:MAG: cytochrome c oxidase subunit II [Candidatus Baltobacteraceae bacterium]
MANVSTPQQKGMGPGFWPVTLGLTVVNVLISIFIVTLPIDKYLPEAAVPSGEIDALFKFMSVLGNAIFVYVVGYLIYFSIVWRHRSTDSPDALGIQIADNHTLEFWWTAIPTVLVGILAVFSVMIWYGLQNQLGDVLTMEAIGHQFNYEFRYPTLKTSVQNDMHVPVNTPVTLHVTSVDVIHSFWVPEVRLKADMVPGLVQTLRFTPTRVGKYRIICTEFCGVGHSAMDAALYVDSQADFSKWLAGQAKGGSETAAGVAGVPLAKGVADQGKVLFGQKCSTCHSIGPFEQKIVGPGLGQISDNPNHPNLITGKPRIAQNIAWILVNGYDGPDKSTAVEKPPIGVMPNRQANALSNRDISNLTAYLMSLK